MSAATVYCLGDDAPCASTAHDSAALVRVCLATSAARLCAAAAGAAGGAGDAGWAADDSVFVEALARGIRPDILDRLTVRVSWPLSSAVEAALLAALGDGATVRVAVRVDPATAAEIFARMNELRVPWVALPAPGRAGHGWAEAMAALCEAWLFDPASATLLEPVASAFQHLVLARLSRAPRATDYRVYRSRAGGCAGPVLSGQWSPSVHAALSAAAPDAIGAMADSWLSRLAELADVLSDEDLRACAGSPAQEA